MADVKKSDKEDKELFMIKVYDLKKSGLYEAGRKSTIYYSQSLDQIISKKAEEAPHTTYYYFMGKYYLIGDREILKFDTKTQTLKHFVLKKGEVKPIPINHTEKPIVKPIDTPVIPIIDEPIKPVPEPEESNLIMIIIIIIIIIAIISIVAFIIYNKKKNQ